MWALGAAGLLSIVVLALYGWNSDEPTPAADAVQGAVEAPPKPAPPVVVNAPPSGASSAPEPSARVAAPVPPAATGRPTRERALRCAATGPGSAKRVQERGRLEARDDVSGTLYAFVVCEERDIPSGAVEIQIKGSNTVGTRWSGEAATKRAAEMESRGVECEPTGQPAVRSAGAHDPRSIVFVLCQQSGTPTSLAVHATTRKADASAYPEKVLRVAWPE
jgi:hypothetical protein